jgi:cytochrome P450
MTPHTVLPLPADPKSRFWGLNHLRAMQADYLGYVSQLQRQHPDMAHVRVFNEHISQVFHPDWVRQILVDQSDALIRWERATDVFSLSMGQSVLVTEGAQWQRQRRMLQPGFTPRRVAGQAALMASATCAALDGLRQQPAGTAVNVEALMTRLTLDVILNTLFGRHQVQDAEPVSQAIQTLSHYGFAQFFKAFSWPLWMPWPAERRARRALSLLNQPKSGSYEPTGSWFWVCQGGSVWVILATT